MLQHLKHNEIDKEKWDHCIQQAQYPLVYAMSWYLDTVSHQWEALIEDDYEAVFPLTRKKKLGITYLYQPFFTQQLGCFTKNPGIHQINAFIKYIEKYLYVDINLNHANSPVQKNGLQERINQRLYLGSHYEDVYGNYSKSHQKNINQALKAGVIMKSIPDPEIFIQQKAINKEPHFNACKLSLLKELLKKANEYGYVEMKGGYLDDQWLTIILFIKFRNQYFLINSTNTDKGKETKAKFLLLDSFIKEKTERRSIINFAGSNIPGVHYFNKGFGAIDEKYYQLTRNNLPWPFKWLKR